MSSFKSEKVQHFTHVHPLTKVDDFGGFICNGCNTYGSEKTYRCASCNYDLHECCATCPPTLHCFLHPQHELKLVFKEPAKTDQLDRRGCNICHELAEGLSYQCEACGFHMHPLCSQLPQQVSHTAHPPHHLELSDHGASNMCMVCHGAIRSWRYKCGPCRLDVHMECVNSSTSATKGTQQRSLESQPYSQPSQYHQQQMYLHPSQYQQPQPQTFFHPSQYQQPQTYFHPPHYQQPQPYFHPYQQPQPYFQPSQYQLPYHNHGCTNQGQQQGQQSGRSTGKKMFGIFMALTIGVASDVVAEAAQDAFFG